MNETATIETPAAAQTTAHTSHPTAHASTPTTAETIAPAKKAKKAKIKKSALPKKVGYFILYVPDMAKAVEFYKSIGLKCGFESPEWTQFKSGIKFALHLTGAPKSEGTCSSSEGSCTSSFVPQKTGLTFEVKDAGKTYEAFKTLGVKVLGEPHQVCEDGRAFAFEDPFGNQLSIYGR